eukprot:gene9982-biopygen8931
MPPSRKTLWRRSLGAAAPLSCPCGYKTQAGDLNPAARLARHQGAQAAARAWRGRACRCEFPLGSAGLGNLGIQGVARAWRGLHFKFKRLCGY